MELEETDKHKRELFKSNHPDEHRYVLVLFVFMKNITISYKGDEFVTITSKIKQMNICGERQLE